MAKKTSLSDPLGIRIKDRGLNRSKDEELHFPEHPLKFRTIRQPSMETRGYTRSKDAHERMEREAGEEAGGKAAGVQRQKGKS